MAIARVTDTMTVYVYGSARDGVLVSLVSVVVVVFSFDPILSISNPADVVPEILHIHMVASWCSLLIRSRLVIKTLPLRIVVNLILQCQVEDENFP